MTQAHVAEANSGYCQGSDETHPWESARDRAKQQSGSKQTTLADIKLETGRRCTTYPVHHSSAEAEKDPREHIHVDLAAAGIKCGRVEGKLRWAGNAHTRTHY